MLIVIEGIDGSGKGTQVDLLCKKLDCRKQMYPDRVGVFGGIFNKVLRKKLDVKLNGEELFVMFLMDMLKDKKMLEEYVGNNERHIVVDRYCYSTLAYQCAQGADYGRGKKIIEGFGLARPDVVLILDVPPEESIRRLDREKEIFENRGFLTKVRAYYKKIYEEKFFAGSIYMIDGSRDVESVRKDIENVLKL